MKYLFAIALTALIGHAIYQGVMNYTEKEVVTVEYMDRGWVNVIYVQHHDTLQLTMTREDFTKEFTGDKLEY